MAKRRSQTRVGRDRPRPTVQAHVLVPALTAYRPAAPVVHGSSVYRVLESAAGQRIVQEWTSGYWMPSLLALFELRDARVATVRDLMDRQVPATDWGVAPIAPVWTTPILTRLPHQDGVVLPRKTHAL